MPGLRRLIKFVYLHYDYAHGYAHSEAASKVPLILDNGCADP